VTRAKSKIKASLGALLFLSMLSAGARADEPTAAAVGYANQIIVDIGLKPSLDQVVPAMMTQLENNVTATRPELKDALRETLIAIAPDFMKTEQPILSDAAHFLATQMTEQELKETAAFFESPTGKKFNDAQGALLNEVGTSLNPWRQRLSTDIMTRTREEMRKKGFNF
jgi:uncharacterized protein